MLIFFTYFFGIPNLGNFLGVAGVSGRDLAKSQFVSTYLKGRIDQWGPRRGVCAKSFDYIDVFFVAFILLHKLLTNWLFTSSGKSTNE